MGQKGLGTRAWFQRNQRSNVEPDQQHTWTWACGAVYPALLVDQVGWHTVQRSTVPTEVSLVPLPSYSLVLSPVERSWLCLRERFFSHRLFADLNAIVDA